MKSRTYLWAAISAFTIAFASCDDYDDTAIREEMSGYDDRISSLEEWQKKVDSNLAALQQLAETQDYITNVKPYLLNGEEVGYEIQFAKSASIIVYHGEEGEKGEQGEQGEKGDKGDKGDQGDPGAQGEKGEQGEKGDKGDQGDPGAQGEKGEQGEKGDKGDKGDTGAAGQDGDAFLTGAPVLSEDGAYYTFTLKSGGSFTVKAYQSFQIGEGENNADLTLTESPQEIKLVLPSDYEASDYSLLIAQITPEGSNGTYTHTASRADAIDGWNVSADLPKSKDNATITVTSPDTGGKALLRITLVRTDGSELTSARVLKREKLDYTIAADGSYTVYTATGLKAWADAIAKSTDFAIDCTLEADIDLTTVEWTPICNDKSYDAQGSSTYAGYSGVFDGQGHTIKVNITSASTTVKFAGVGLFGCVGEEGVVKNCNVEGTVIGTVKGDAVGGIAGISSGLIINCSFKGEVKYTTTDKSPSGNVGGIVGTYNKGNVVACRSYVELETTVARAAGIAGKASYGSPNNLVACYAHITSFTSKMTGGGVLGEITYMKDNEMLGCYWSKETNLTLPKNGYFNTNQSGQNRREATEVTDGNWTDDPLTKMNETLSTNGYNYQYIENTGDDKEYFPLIVVEKVNE